MILRVLVVASAIWIATCTVAWAGPDEPGAKKPDPCAPPKCECYTCECNKAKDPKCPAKYDVRPFMENWKACKCLPCVERGDWTDMMKAVPLSRGIWANFGGQVRARFESFTNQAFGAPADADDNWMLLRILAHADIHFGDWGRVYLEGIYANQWERELGPRGIDVNEGDLLNGFVEVNGCNLSGWVGRRELLEGQQRLIGPLDWANTRRTFQGAGAMWKCGFHEVEAFAVRPMFVEEDEFDKWNDDVALFGAVYRNRVWSCVKWEAYLLGLQRDEAIYAGVADDETRITIGGHADGKIANTRFDYDGEAAYQFGSFGDGDISAGFVSLTFGWKPCTRCLEPRVAVGFDWASGDDDPLDGDVQTFNQLFPTAHKFFGIADVLGRPNLVAGRLEGSIKPFDKVTVVASYQGFWRANENDGSYTVGGGLQRAGTPADDDFLGTELDLLVKYNPERHWAFVAGWGHFFTGDFYSDTGADEDITFFYLSAQVTV